MFLGFPIEIHEEKPSFLDFENNWLRTQSGVPKIKEFCARNAHSF